MALKDINWDDEEHFMQEALLNQSYIDAENAAAPAAPDDEI